MAVFSSPWYLSKSKLRASHGQALGQPGELYSCSLNPRACTQAMQNL